MPRLRASRARPRRPRPRLRDPRADAAVGAIRRPGSDAPSRSARLRRAQPPRTSRSSTTIGSRRLPKTYAHESAASRERFADLRRAAGGVRRSARLAQGQRLHDDPAARSGRPLGSGSAAPRTARDHQLRRRIARLGQDRPADAPGARDGRRVLPDARRGGVRQPDLEGSPSPRGGRQRDRRPRRASRTS